MIDLQNIHLSFADRVVFEGITWSIADKSRIGLVGDNGTGKTTLFRTILAEVEPDEGKVTIPARKKKVIGYLPQDVAELEPLPLMDYLKQRSGIAGVEETIAYCETRLPGLDPGSGAYQETLGDLLFNKIIANKKLELDRYNRYITDYEIQEYLPIL